MPPLKKGAIYFFGYSNLIPGKVQESVEELNRLLTATQEIADDANIEQYILFSDYDFVNISIIENFDFPVRKFKEFTFIEKNIEREIFRNNLRTHATLGQLQHAKDWNITLPPPLIGIIRCCFEVWSRELDDLIRDKINYHAEKCEIEQVRIIKSFSWDDVTIIINSFSYGKIMNFVDSIKSLSHNFANETNPALKRLSEAFNLSNQLLLNSTNTILGIDKKLLEKKSRGTLYNKLHTKDKLKFYITANYENIFQHNQICNCFPQYDIRYQPGIEDLIITPTRNRAISSRLFVKRFYEFHLKITEHDLENSFKTYLIDFNRLVTPINNLLDDTALLEKLQVSDDKLKKHKELLREYKIATPTRDMLVNLIMRYNNLLETSRMTSTFLELSEPIHGFINLISSERENHKEMDVFELNILVSRFANALKSSINNRLNSSLRFRFNNQYSHSFYIGINSYLSSVDGFVKLFSEHFTSKRVFSFLDYRASISLSKFAIRINLYHIFKPEIFASTIVSELFNIRLIDSDGDGILPIEFLRVFDSFNPKKAKKAIKNVIDQSLITQYSGRVKYLKSQEIFEVVIGDKLFDHVFCDIIGYYKVFKENFTLFSFWHWAIFKSSFHAYTIRSQSKFEPLAIKKWLLRYLIICKFLEKRPQEYLVLAGTEINSLIIGVRSKYISFVDNFIGRNKYFMELKNEIISESKKDVYHSRQSFFSDANFDSALDFLNEYLNDIYKFLKTKVDGRDYKFSYSGGIIDLNPEVGEKLFGLRNKFLFEGMKLSDDYKLSLLKFGVSNNDANTEENESEISNNPTR